MSGGAGDRLSRLLAMVPYLLGRQGVSLADAARHFDVSEDQLVADLELLFVCGTPGHLPDDLIEADWDSGHVYLGNADAIARPLRLGVDEAIALIVGLRTLADVPGVAGGEDRAAVEGALVKLSAAAGELAATASAVQVDLEAGSGDAALATARTALRERRRLHLRYLVPSRDETTERDVDPMRVVSLDGRWYLEAWCHGVEDVRLFRLDRVQEATLLDADGTPPPQAVGRDLTEDLFQPGEHDVLVTLDLEPSARWVAEYYPTEDVQQPGDGRTRVSLRTADPGWLVRLALRLGGQARVVGPPEVAAQVRAAARSALDAYTASAPQAHGDTRSAGSTRPAE